MNIRMFPGQYPSKQLSQSSPVSSVTASATPSVRRHTSRKHASGADTSDTAVDLSPTDRHLLLRHRALVSAQRGEYQQAVELFDRLIELNPTDASHYNNRGLIHFQSGDPEAALADYDRAIELNPRLAKVYNNRANCYAALGELEAAIQDYEMAIDLNPTNIRALLNQGITFRDLGLYEQAIEDFELALNLSQLLQSSENEVAIEGHIYAERGRTYHLMGDWNYALADYQRALNELPLASSPTAMVSYRLRLQVSDWLESLLRPLSA